VVSATVVDGGGGGGSVGTKTSPTVGRKSWEEVYSVSAPGAGALSCGVGDWGGGWSGWWQGWVLIF